MTTIAFRDNVMACDSCLTEGDQYNARYIGDVDKIYRLCDGSLLGASGDAEIQGVIDILEDPKIPDREIAARLSEMECECECLLVRLDGRMFWIATDGAYGEFTEFRDKFAAVGTGKDFAYGAMEAGASALMAVEAASRRHSYTRGPFVTFNLIPNSGMADSNG